MNILCCVESILLPKSQTCANLFLRNRCLWSFSTAFHHVRIPLSFPIPWCNEVLLWSVSTNKWCWMFGNHNIEYRLFFSPPVTTQWIGVWHFQWNSWWKKIFYTNTFHGQVWIEQQFYQILHPQVLFYKYSISVSK